MKPNDNKVVKTTKIIFKKNFQIKSGERSQSGGSNNAS